MFIKKDKKEDTRNKKSIEKNKVFSKTEDFKKKIDKKNIIMIALLSLLFLALLMWFFIKGQTNIKLVNDKNYNQNNASVVESENKNGIKTGVVKIDNVSKKTTSFNKVKKEIKRDRLIRISRINTSGVKFWEKTESGYSVEYFVENGKTFIAKTNIFKENIDNELKSIIKSTEAYKNIYDVKWISKTKRVISYADRFGNKKVIISDGNKNKVISGKIETVSVADDGQIFYILVKNERAEGYVLNPFTNKTKLVFKSELTQWNSDWRGTNRVLIYPKPISSKKSVAYLVNTSTGIFVKESDEYYGLTALENPIVSKIAFFAKETEKGPQKIIIKDLRNKKILKINYKTFAGKCVWSKNNIDLYCALPKILKSVNKTEPDEWYKGITKFEDKMIVINTNTGDVRELFDPEDPEDSRNGHRYRFDIIKPALSNNDDYIYFTNKETMNSWAYRIK